MNIVIVGGGLVGSTLAGKLARDGHDVTLVESDAAMVRELSEAHDIQVIHGNGATAPVLRRAGIERAEMVVAVTHSDEANMVVGLLGSTLFRVEHILVRLRSADHAEGFTLIGRDHPAEHVCINPDAAAVERIASLLEVPGAIDVVHFMNRQLVVAGFRIAPGSDFAHQPVSFMGLAFADTPTNVVAIARNEDWIIPHGDEEIRPGDLVYFAIARDELSSVVSLVGAPDEQRRHIMVAGAGWIGLELARRLEGSERRVILVEEDPQLASAANEVLKHTLVVQGNVTDQTLLEEEDIDRVAAFVALTDNHETNLVACLLAKRLGAGRVFALVDNPALVHLIGDVGIDSVISPRSLAIDQALQHIRGHGVRAVAELLTDQIEVVELEASKGSRIVSAPLAQAGLPRGVLVAALRRGESLVLPRGDDQVQPGDEVLLITTTANASKIAEYLSG